MTDKGWIHLLVVLLCINVTLGLIAKQLDTTNHKLQDIEKVMASFEKGEKDGDI